MKLPRHDGLGGLAGLAFLLAFAFGTAGCAQHIGDHCVLSTDCSVTGDRVCDTSQPNGYCTQLGCNTNSCPDNAVCVIFQPSIPGCGYDDYSSPSRTGRSFCEAHCDQDSDCRQSEGYICRKPTDDPWNGQILDDNQNQRVCIVRPGRLQSTPSQDAAVCSALPLETGPSTGDGGSDGGLASNASASDAGDASLDGGEASIARDAAADAGPADAASGD